MSDIFENFRDGNFWVNGITEEILDEVDSFHQMKDKVEFIDDIIKFCNKLKFDLTNDKEYIVWDNRKKVEFKVFETEGEAEDEVDRLIHAKDGHVHWSIKKRYKEG